MDPSLPHRLRENARIAPYGSRGHEATIVALDTTDQDLFFTAEWTGRKTKPLLGPIMAKPADDVVNVGCMTCHRGSAIPMIEEAPAAD